MRVRKHIWLLFGACSLALVMVWGIAQDASEVELIRSRIQTERRVILVENLNLTDAESLAFWPVYNKYEQDKGKVVDRAVELLRRYEQNWDSMQDVTALQMLEEHLNIQAQLVSVQKKHVRNFKKVLSPVKVLRFYQTEHKLDSFLNSELAETIPLVQVGGE